MEMTWVDFYTKFAVKLMDFKNDRTTLVAKLKKAFADANVNIPTIEDNNNNITDVDPFTMFALFNRQIADDRRRAIISAFNNEFNVNASIPSDYNGIPVMNNMMTAFFTFSSGRPEHDIDNLWEFFDVAMKFANDPSYEQEFIRLYDICESQRCVKWNLTMALFWINPDFYIALDSRNRWFLTLNEYFSDEFVSFIKNHHASEKSGQVPSGKEYIEIRQKCIDLVTKSPKYNSLIALSDDAFRISEEVNQQNKEKQKNQEAQELILEDRGVHTWLYSPGDNADHFEEFCDSGIFAIDWNYINKPAQYSKDELRKILQEESGDTASHKNAVNCIWEFIHEIEVGDVVFAKKGRYTIIGRGIVESEYVYDETRNNFCNVRKIKWTHKGNWEHPGQAAMKTLTDITDYVEYVDKLNKLVSEGEEVENIEPEIKEATSYTKDDFLNEVYISEDSYDRLVNLLLKKKNLILQGAPGVGKSFAAKRLAYSMMGEKASNRVEMIQFHQSYSYEDLIMGYRPNGDGFELGKGAFYNFCKKAEDDPDNQYFFIIDEINRGNLNKIFGELFLLLEADKRNDTKIRLLYSNELFSIPSNVYIIGMMNTADRSLAMMDYALRRRFAFFTLEPAFDSEGFKRYQYALENEKFNKLIDTIVALNIDIVKDESLGKGFMIGHSYFCNINSSVTDELISDIIEYEMIPLLEEYWFDDQSKVVEWTNKLRGVLK